MKAQSLKLPGSRGDWAHFDWIVCHLCFCLPINLGCKQEHASIERCIEYWPSAFSIENEHFIGVLLYPSLIVHWTRSFWRRWDWCWNKTLFTDWLIINRSIGNCTVTMNIQCASLLWKWWRNGQQVQQRMKRWESGIECLGRTWTDREVLWRMKLFKGWGLHFLRVSLLWTL